MPEEPRLNRYLNAEQLPTIPQNYIWSGTITGTGTTTWSMPTWTGTSSGTINLYTWAGTVIQPSNATLRFDPLPGPVNEAQREAARVEREHRAAARTAAIDRAEGLLMSFLSDDQRASYRQSGTFEIIGSLGNVYRIERGSSGNVVWLGPDGVMQGRLCAHPDMREQWLPNGDVALCQMLAIQTDEAAFLRIANVHAGRRPPIPAFS